MERERFLLPVDECAPDSRMRAVQYEYCRIYETADRGDENLQDGKMPGEKGRKSGSPDSTLRGCVRDSGLCSDVFTQRMFPDRGQL